MLGTCKNLHKRYSPFPLVGRHHVHISGLSAHVHHTIGLGVTSGQRAEQSPHLHPTPTAKVTCDCLGRDQDRLDSDPSLLEGETKGQSLVKG